MAPFCLLGVVPLTTASLKTAWTDVGASGRFPVDELLAAAAAAAFRVTSRLVYLPWFPSDAFFFPSFEGFLDV